MTTVISIENLSKYYRLGTIGNRTLNEDLNRWWARLHGNSDPTLKIGETDYGNREDEYIWALKDVSFQVLQGEVLGIIGRNGAGKSTLLKILSQVTAPTSGEVKVKGRIASLLEVGTGFHPELTGRENIYLNGAILGMSRPEIDRKLDEIIDFSGVEKFIDTPVKRYSSGMYVRLAFAVAAHLEPEILIVDEVLAVGDAEFQKKCLGKMSDVASEGRTVLFVSHNMAAVENLCKAGIVLRGGRLEYLGTQTDAIKNYLSSIKENKTILSNPDNRPGSGLIRIIDVNIKNAAGDIVDVVQSGQDIDICLQYKSAPEYSPAQKVHVGITVANQLGLNIFSHSTRVSKLALRDLAESGIFTCHITNLPLPPSTYIIGFALKVDDMYADASSDFMELSVVEGDFFKTGATTSTASGLVLVNADWRQS